MYTQTTLEQLAASLSDLPGFNGYSWMLEPSISVTGLRPGVRDLLALEAAALPGVRAPVRHGTEHHRRSWRASKSSGAVAEALQERLAGRHIVEIRWPEGRSRRRPRSSASAIVDAFAPSTLRDVSGVARRWLALTGSPAIWPTCPPSGAVLSTLGATAAEAAGKFVALLDVLEPALALTEAPDEQGARLSEVVRSGEGVDAVRKALFGSSRSTCFVRCAVKRRPRRRAGPDQSVDPALLRRGRILRNRGLAVLP